MNLNKFLQQVRLGGVSTTKVSGEVMAGALAEAMSELSAEQASRDKGRLKTMLSEIRAKAESLAKQRRDLQRQLDELQENTEDFARRLTYFNQTGNPFSLTNAFDEGVDSHDLSKLREVPKNLEPDKQIIKNFAG